MKYVIHSVSPTPQPFLFTFPFLTAAPMCFLGGPVLFDMFMCIVHAWTIIFDTFWQCGIESMCFAKSCDPNYPQNARKNPANARKNCQTRANPDFWSFRVIWVVLQRTHFWPCLKDNEFNRSHAHSVCLGLPIKQQGLNRYFGLMVSRWGNHDAHNLFLQRSPCFHFMTSNRCVFLWNASLP